MTIWDRLNEFWCWVYLSALTIGMIIMVVVAIIIFALTLPYTFVMRP